MSLYAKRLEHGRFVWPRRPMARLRSAPAQLSYLLEASIGATRNIRGGRRARDRLKQCSERRKKAPQIADFMI